MNNKLELLQEDLKVAEAKAWAETEAEAAAEVEAAVEAWREAEAEVMARAEAWREAKDRARARVVRIKAEIAELEKVKC